ncbi:MAG: methyltransferase domain-containing protein, partial [Thermoanaerobaculia bacterium]|nr:methyltransferase domain-containing protein [Thermoanaerobaculia bacterium]
EIEDPRARFRVAAAARIGEVVEGTFDRVLCNAAFWQFPSLEEAVRAVAGILDPGGLFVFNLPVSRLAGGDVSGGGLQTALARAVEEGSGEPFRTRTVEVDPGRLEEVLISAEFSSPDRTRWTIPTTEGEVLELLRLPTMIGRIAPDLDPEARRRVLERVEESVDRDRSTEVEWEIWSQTLTA